MEYLNIKLKSKEQMKVNLHLYQQMKISILL